MEGPTPVSALIHAATMVTAGVYLIARSMPLIALAPGVQVLIAVTGCATAVLSASIALTQNDLKRVLAYSTVSQLGYMFMGLGAGVSDGAQLAVVAAMFHLFTHAFFKGLLFLASGSVMHAMGDVMDMRRFGGLRHRLPLTHVTFAIGGLALAGIPPLRRLLQQGRDSPGAEVGLAFRRGAGVEMGLLADLRGGHRDRLDDGLLHVRAYFMTFWGPEERPAGEQIRSAPDGGGAAGLTATRVRSAAGIATGTITWARSRRVMTLPLLILAGRRWQRLLSGPTHLFEHRSASDGCPGNCWASGEHRSTAATRLGTVGGLLGIGLAYRFYAAGELPFPAGWPTAPALYEASLNKFYVGRSLRAGVVVRRPRSPASVSSWISTWWTSL